MVFIDGSNLYYGCKMFGMRPPGDVVVLARALAGPERKFVRTYYYNARSRKEDVPPERYDAEQRFYEYLQHMDYCTVRLGRLEGPKGNVHQKGVDVLLVQDLLTLAFTNAFDVAILVTNDGDYASVLEELKSWGKQVEVAYLGQPSYHLRTACDRYVDLLTAPPGLLREEPTSNRWAAPPPPNGANGENAAPKVQGGART
jgi:uncharacterized LabA/DUF88 family protein